MAQEIERLVGNLLRQAGAPDLEASELFIRSSVHEVGGKLLERVLNHEAGAGAAVGVQCGAGHVADLVDYRSKELNTVLGPIRLRRAYYYCGDCGAGVLPRDEELDIVGTSFSPGVRRMMGRMGGKESFNEARDDIAAIAGIKVKTKAVERVAEKIGAQIRMQPAETVSSAIVLVMEAIGRSWPIYIARRKRLWAARPHSSYLFISNRGNRLDGGEIHRTFYALSRQIGLRGVSDSHGPRLHDLRHRFAVKTLLHWYAAGEDTERRLPILSAYLGHVHVADTYWYLSAWPELMHEAMRRLERRWGAQS